MPEIALDAEYVNIVNAMPGGEKNSWESVWEEAGLVGVRALDQSGGTFDAKWQYSAGSERAIKHLAAGESWRAPISIAQDCLSDRMNQGWCLIHERDMGTKTELTTRLQALVQAKTWLNQRGAANVVKARNKRGLSPEEWESQGRLDYPGYFFNPVREKRVQTAIEEISKRIAAWTGDVQGQRPNLGAMAEQELLDTQRRSLEDRESVMAEREEELAAREKAAAARPARRRASRKKASKKRAARSKERLEARPLVQPQLEDLAPNPIPTAMADMLTAEDRISSEGEAPFDFTAQEPTHVEVPVESGE